MAGRLLSALGALVRPSGPAYQGLPASEPSSQSNKHRNGSVIVGAVSGVVSRFYRNTRLFNLMLVFVLCLAFLQLVRSSYRQLRCRPLANSHGN